MKKHKRSFRKIAPITAVAGAVALAASANAQTTPVFNYSFPSSWGGSGTAVTDQSAAGNNGSLVAGTYGGSGATYAYTTAAVPPGAAGGTGSLALAQDAYGYYGAGILTTGKSLVNNAAVASAGGFSYNINFQWNGTDSHYFGHTEKLIDYAGTESLQLITTASGTATLEMVMDENNSTGNNINNMLETVVASTTINANTWYNVNFIFNTAGNSLIGGGIAGVGSLYVNGSLAGSSTAIKGSYGDSLNRPIGVGLWGEGYQIIGLNGDVYGASVDLGADTAPSPVPEPSSMALGLIGGLGGLGMMWRVRRRNS